MIPASDPKSLESLKKNIDMREQAFLEDAIPQEFNLFSLLNEETPAYFAVHGLADFWSSHSEVDFGQHIVDMIVGAHDPWRAESDLIVVLEGTMQRTSLFISLGDEVKTKTLLKGIFPGIHLSPCPATDMARRLLPAFQTKGMVTGIPERGTSSEQTKHHKEASGSQHSRSQSAHPQQTAGTAHGQGLARMERVIRGMQGAMWAYVVRAKPCQRKDIIQDRLATLEELTLNAKMIRMQIQQTNQESQQTTELDNKSRTTTLSGEQVNYHAQYLVHLLERGLERLNMAMALGQWQVRTCFGASTLDDARRLSALLQGTLTATEMYQQPVRTFLCSRGGDDLGLFESYLSSDELATLVQFPREEVSGYAIHDFVRFDVDFQPPTTSHKLLTLGHIQQNGQDTHEAYQLTQDDLTKHAVVVGVTGSGKTTTVMNLLDSMVSIGKSFLVIEPAKTEYRRLRSALAGRREVRIYTLGREDIAPFRLNPFEFETNDKPGSASILNHIDFLKAVFNAAFALFPPMPYVLEMALHEIYEDKGWDLASGLNTRLPDWTKRDQYPIFPTLAELQRKVEVVMNRLGYAGEVDQNVRAALKARIGSMRVGAKGMMLDVARGVPMRELLAEPTILELENIGSDEEKTFLMGILLARLYEYRRLEADMYAPSGELQHLIVFEEAHRLLKNTETQVDAESSNMRAQAIETFTNMLSEVRAYGQGVLVAEQIPGKLAPDVLKNTNLKVVHRLVAQDDRESVGQTINLNAEQMTYLGVLSPGMAAVYAEGADHAYLVRLNNYKRTLSTLDNETLSHLSPAYISVSNSLAVPDIGSYFHRLTPFGGPETSLFQAAAKLLDTEQSKRIWASILIRTVFRSTYLSALLKQLARLAEQLLPALLTNQRDLVLRMVIVQGCAETLSERGAHVGWPYPLVEKMRGQLTRGLLALYAGEESKARPFLSSFAREYENRLTWSGDQERQGPFAGCMHCRAKCVYRPDVRYLLSGQDTRRLASDLSSPELSTNDELYTEITRMFQALASRWLGDERVSEHPDDVLNGLAYCSALHGSAILGHDEYEQASFGDHLNPFLLK